MNFNVVLLIQGAPETCLRPRLSQGSSLQAWLVQKGLEETLSGKTAWNGAEYLVIKCNRYKKRCEACTLH